MENEEEKNVSVAAQRLAVKETRSTELSSDEEEYWEEMTKNRLKSEGIQKRKDIALVVVFIIMCILCVVLLYLYDQQLWIFENPYKK